MTKSEFFSELSASWDREHSRPGELERLRDFAGHFRLGPGERVLDAGCGSGRLVALILEEVGAGGSLVELDFAPGMIERARLKTADPRVDFQIGDAHDLPFPDSDFNKVIALALLPHLDDRCAALKEFRRVLKPGGMLVIAHQLGREALDRLHAESSGPVRRDRLPEKAVLAGWLATAGFSSCEIVDEPGQYIAWALA
ncbi:MAG: methyltransferase domain-containing protein [Acidobacteria bacterium]|jgi:demethylmenaquinone methyltransferase/2-methoxy-6-polyprenyl-1,4-benzoquinol methylase|nr:methyltransferase domain-containing protein [Acidobacteriota bacterium]